VKAAAERTLLRVYPPAWRARYGDELRSLIAEARANGDRSTPAIVLDVLFAGVTERLRSVGLLPTGPDPEDRARAGVLRVLWAWVVFVLGGIGVAKASEHWGRSVPSGSRGVPQAAFDVLLLAAVVGSAAVLLGGMLPARRMLYFLRAGGWSQVRRPILRALALTVLAGTGLVAVALSAHHLSNAQRNGADALYGGVVLAWAVLFAACLFAWVIAAVATARALRIAGPLLGAETVVASTVVLAMCVMAVSTAVWWSAVARSAPWYFAGTAPGTAGTVAPVNLLVPAAFMLAGVALGLSGALDALRSAPRTSTQN
jgi:hypothetical protein